MNRIKFGSISILGLMLSVGTASAATRYVNPASPAPGAPYDTWATAGHEIQTVVGVSAAGDVVVVTNGLYNTGGRVVYGSLTNRVAITNAITVISVNGPAATVIEGGGPRGPAAVRCAMLDCQQGAAVLSGFTLTNGHTLAAGDVNYEQCGGGAWCFHGDLNLLSNCVVAGCSANQFGGGVYMGGVYDSLIVGNHAAGLTSFNGGGGVWGGTVYRSRISRNTSAYWAGGVKGSALYSCLVDNNYCAYDGGGAYGATVYNCTFVSNSGWYAGGIRDSTAYNSIFYNNIARQGTVSRDNVWNYFGGSCTFCCATPLQGGTGNFTNEPGFMDLGGENYRLAFGAPCIDRGTNQAWMVDVLDLDGHPRIVNYIVDIGAYEYFNPHLNGTFTGAPLAGPAPLFTVFAAQVFGTNLNQLYYQWDYENDGVIDAEGYDLATVTNSGGYVEPRYYSVALTVSNEVGEAFTKVRTNYVRVAPAWVNVSPNGGHVYPYTNWALAATNLAHAVSMVAPHGAVWVTNGDYAITAQLALDSGLQLRSLQGAAQTVIRRAGGSNHRVLYITHSNAVVDGFTLSNGYVAAHGAGIYMTGGRVQNCRIIGNSNYELGAYRGGGIYMDNGTVTNCLVSGNRANHFGAGVYLLHGLLSRCLVSNNTLAANGGGVVCYNDSVVENCVIRNNAARDQGGGLVANGLARNCVIADNTINLYGGGVFIDEGRLQGCTISRNSAGTSGGGLGVGNATAKSIENCAIWNNAAPSGPNYAVRDGVDATFAFCCSTPLPNGAGNVTNPPLFADDARGDYRTLWGSATIDAGTNQDWMAGAVDLQGRTRIINGRVDIGAYEFESQALMLAYPYRDLFVHDTRRLEWFLSGVDTNAVRVDITIASHGLATMIATGVTRATTFDWDTTTAADDRYEMTFTLRDAGGAILATDARWVVVNNGAVWHSGTVTNNETWVTGRVHIVDGVLTIATNATVSVPGGAIVKVLPQGGFVVEGGGQLHLQAGPPAVLTSIYDDAVSGDDNHDADLTRPQPGDWRGFTVHAGGQVADDGADIRYVLVLVSGSLLSDATWRGSYLYLVTNDFTIPAGRVLTIQPGTVVKFAALKGMTVEAGGLLVAEGTLAEPITFTSIKDDTAGGDANQDGNNTVPGAGDWGMLLVQGTARLRYVDLRYGSGNNSGSWNNTAMVKVDGVGAVLDAQACRLSYALYDAISTWNNSTALVANCAVFWNDRGILIRETSAATVLNCAFYDNRWGMCPHGGISRIYNCIVSKSLEYGIFNCCGGSWDIQYNNVWGSGVRNYGSGDYTGQNGNISKDPLFKNPGAAVFQLQFGSPCIDAADGLRAPAIDYMGASRYTDPRSPHPGVPATNGAYADMGAFEFVENAESAIDLVAADVSGPASALAGGTATVTWYVKNLGSELCQGSWHDEILLTPDEPGRWDAAVAVTQPVSTASIGPGQSAAFTATVRVPGGTPGPWRWSVHANARGEIFEGRNAGNNRSGPSAPMALSVPELALGLPLTNRFAGSGAAAWYQFVAPAGTDVVVALDAAAETGRVRLYAGRGSMPTATRFDYRSAQWNSPDATLAIPASASNETVYLMAMPESLGGSNRWYQLAAGPAGFDLLGLGLAGAGNAGPCTVPVSGRGFNAGLAVRLDPAAGGTPVAATAMKRVDSTQVYATFDLQGVAPGVFHAVAQQAGGERVLSNAFTVAAGTGGRLNTRIVVPERVRANREFTGYVVYENAGDGNLAAPWLYLKGMSGATLLWEPGKTNQAVNGLRFLGVAQEGPLASVLIPGATGRFEFKARVSNTGQALFYLYALTAASPDLMDFATLAVDVTPADPHPLWSNAWARVVQEAGATQGSYIAMLQQAADRARDLGLVLVSEQDLLEFLVAEAMEQVQIAPISGTAFLRETNQPLSRVVLTLAPVWQPDNPTNYYETITWYDGSFGFRNVPAGEYILSAAGYWPPQLLTIALEDPAQPVSNLLAFASEPAATISGLVCAETIGGAVVPDAIVWARRRDFTMRFSGAAQSNGYYFIGGLPSGPYDLEVQAAGYAPARVESIELGSGAAYQYSPVVTRGSALLRGVVQQPGGQPAAGAMVWADWQDPDPLYGAWRGALVLADGAGRFQVPVVGGQYRVAAAAGGLGEADPVTVQVTAVGTSAVAAVALRQSVTLTGRVVDADTALAVTGAWITVDSRPPQQTPIVTDAAGWFVISNLAPRAYQVAARTADHHPAVTNLTLLAGGNPPLVLALARHGLVTGVVRNAGAPARRVPVSLLFGYSDYQLGAMTDDSGAYQFRNVPTGAYSVVVGGLAGASAGRADFVLRSANPVQGLAHEFNVSAVSGRVFAAGSLVPASTNVHVTLYREAQLVDERVLDPQGAYLFWLAQTGAYAVAAYSTEALLHPVPVDVADPGSAIERNLELATNSLKVILTDAADQPITNAQVGLTVSSALSSNLLRQLGNTDATGQHTFPGLAAGEYRFEALARGWQYAGQTVAVAAGTNQLELQLEPGCVLSGRVVAADTGLGLRYVRLDLCSVAGLALATVTDTNGFYSFTAAAPAVYTLAVIPSWDYETVFQTNVVVDAAAPRTESFILALAPTATVSGVVRDTAGRLVTGAGVILRTAQGSIVASGVTDNQGAFGLVGWPAGIYMLETRALGYGSRAAGITLTADTPVAGLVLALDGPHSLQWPAARVTPYQAARRAGQFPRGELMPVPPSPEASAAIEAGVNAVGDFLGMCGDVANGELGLPSNPADAHQNLNNRDWKSDFSDPLTQADAAGKVCDGVMDAFNEGWDWNNNIRVAYDGWYSSWDAMRQQNNADTGLYLSKASLLGAKAVKLCMNLKSLASKMPGGNKGWDLQGSSSLPIPTELQKPLAGAANDLFGTVGMINAEEASGKPPDMDKLTAQCLKDGSSTYKLVDGALQAPLRMEIDLQKSLLKGIDQLSQHPAQFIDVVEDQIKPNLAQLEGRLNSIKGSKVTGGVMLGADIANALYDIYALIKDYMQLKKELDQFPQDVADRAQKYMDAQDQYSECVENYQKSKLKMQAAIKNCKTSSSAKPGSPGKNPLQNPEKIDQQTSKIPVSGDPNEKVAAGYGPAGYVLAAERLYYTIRFENVATAAAPAQVVVVTDQLATNLDWSTFQLEEMGFNNTVVAVPAGLADFTAWTNVATDANPVRARGVLDPATGIATWRIESIDPVTQDNPEDPLLGFLPPNTTNHIGEGYVSFSIALAGSPAARLEITNTATIVFDVNEAIVTPAVTNTVAGGAPVSAVLALPEMSPPQFTLAWGGSDGGPGIRGYDIYMAQDRGAYELWRTNTTETGAAFGGQIGSLYWFYSVATDNLGQREAKPVTPDALTRIAAGLPWLQLLLDE